MIGAETCFDDPFYDLSYFAMKLDYDKNQEHLLISNYLQRNPSFEELERFNLVKRIQQAFWSLTNLYLADVELKKNPSQSIHKNISLKDWGHYQKMSADGHVMTAQDFYELSCLNYHIANE